jgi:hypothetical protein
MSIKSMALITVCKYSIVKIEEAICDEQRR